MPGGDPRRYHDWKIVRYHRWLERRTLTQYALLLGVYVFVVTTVVMAVIWWLVPHSWLGPYPLVYPLAALPGFTVLYTAQQTWQRQKALQQTGTRRAC
jgi:hypothetical protein